MSKRVRISAFLAAMSCFVLAAGFYYLGFELSPLSFTFADGATTPYPSEQVHACLSERVLSWFGDLNGEAYWLRCRQQLAQYGALGGIELRFWSIAGSGLAGFVALFVFALSVRFAKHAPKVIRGAWLQAGRRGQRAFARACAAIPGVRPSET
jgi:hypothetical protein